jgi:hypothetical protein
VQVRYCNCLLDTVNIKSTEVIWKLLDISRDNFLLEGNYFALDSHSG